MDDEPTSAEIAKATRMLKRRGSTGASTKEICARLRISWKRAVRICVHLWRAGKVRQSWALSKSRSGKVGPSEMRWHLL